MADEFVEFAKQVVKTADEGGLVARLMGACAFRIHCHESQHLYEKIDRPITDVDLATYSKNMGKLDSLLKKLGYLPDSRAIAFFGRNRRIYLDERKKLHIDVFLDRLEMCHTIDFRNRLEADHPTIPLAELLLEKMQIVKIAEKDLKDTLILITEHAIGNGDDETINRDHLCKLLSDDWGFYYTVTTNLKLVREFSQSLSILSANDLLRIEDRIDSLLRSIEETPKTYRWKARAKIGTRKIWYNEIEELTK